MSTVDESLAKALGWETSEERAKRLGIYKEPRSLVTGVYHGWWRPQSTGYELLPNWSESFDACLRDIVPVLRARGVHWTIHSTNPIKSYLDYEPHVEMFWYREGVMQEFVCGDGVSLPAAFCEAALVALEGTS